MKHFREKNTGVSLEAQKSAEPPLKRFLVEGSGMAFDYQKSSDPPIYLVVIEGYDEYIGKVYKGPNSKWVAQGFTVSLIVSNFSTMKEAGRFLKQRHEKEYAHVPRLAGDIL